MTSSEGVHLQYPYLDPVEPAEGTVESAEGMVESWGSLQAVEDNLPEFGRMGRLAEWTRC